MQIRFFKGYALILECEKAILGATERHGVPFHPSIMSVDRREAIAVPLIVIQSSIFINY